MPAKNKHTLQHHRKNHKPKRITDNAFNKVYWPYIPVVLLVSLGITFSSFGATAISAISGSRVLSYASSMSVQGLLSETNNQRAANGVANLALNSKLNASAQAKANDMATRNYWSHNTPEGNPPWVFIDAEGYTYLKVGENLATGFSSEAATINGWMNSPGHKANMLDSAFVDVGFGFANNANYTSATPSGGPMTIVVAHYGKPTGSSGGQAVQPPASCPSGQTGTPPSCTTPSSVESASNQNTPPNTSTTPTSASPINNPQQATPPTSRDIVTPTELSKSPEGSPVTNLTPASSEPKTKNTTAVGNLFSNPTMSRFALALTLTSMFALAIYWINRHLITLKKMIFNGESFVIHHPIVDIVIISLTAAAYALTRTSGFIR